MAICQPSTIWILDVPIVARLMALERPTFSHVNVFVARMEFISRSHIDLRGEVSNVWI